MAQLGASRAALAAGIHLMLHPATTEMFNVAGMLAPDGRCKTLDAAADGYVRSEAAMAIHLHTADSLSAAAAAARDAGTADVPAGGVLLLLGSAVNQDGRSSSLTAPNGPAQQALARSALAAARLPAAKINALQMHGTGECVGSVTCARVLSHAGRACHQGCAHADRFWYCRHRVGRPDRGWRGAGCTHGQAAR